MLYYYIITLLFNYFIVKMKVIMKTQLYSLFIILICSTIFIYGSQKSKSLEGDTKLNVEQRPTDGTRPAGDQAAVGAIPFDRISNGHEK